jgi:hypothetical protein
MFFRRIKPEQHTFDQRVSALKSLGMNPESDSKGGYKVSRNGYAAQLSSDAGSGTIKQKAGLLIGKEIGHLTSAGYQMFFRTDSGITRPARAEQLKALHDFTEDLREGLGETSLYNQGLGTTTEAHLYDRVEDRDHGVPHRAWEK